LCLAGALLFHEFSPLIYHAQWSNRLNKGFDIWESNSEEGKSYIEQTFADARAANLPAGALVGLHRDYARFLYKEDEKEKGDQQIASAIALLPASPASGSGDADQLIHAYQERAWDSHQRWLLDHSKPSGESDQELSVSISEKSFGPEHEQTIYKMPTLAVIFADLGYEDKADKLIQKAVTISDTNPGASECAWFSYAMLARIRAVQHKYKAAAIAYSHGIDISKDQQQRNRVWEEFSTGLRQGQPPNSKTDELTKSLLMKDKFDELDRLGDKLVSLPTSTADGFWELDHMMDALAGGRTMNDSEYQQNVYDLSHWLSKNPHSPHARIALAQCHIYGAWNSRNRENGDVSADAKTFHDCLEKARMLLKADPGVLKKKTPVAYVALARLAVADGDKTTYLRLLNECHAKWPKYYCIDDWAVRFSLPHFFGQPGDVEKYIKSRSDAIFGKEGDVEYARLVWGNQDKIKNLFAKDSPIKWKRVKAGFKRIFAEYPHDMETRIGFMQLTFDSYDSDALLSCLDDFQSSVPPVATVKP
jgi:tetratricopeptide (TPR) repeat protein